MRGTSGNAGSDSVSNFGTVSKCEFRGTERVDREEMREEMTSGEVGSIPLREGSDLRRRRRLSRADSAWMGFSFDIVQ